MNQATLTTNNPCWGFYNAMGETADQAWPMAMTAIAQATDCEPEQVQAFLDSRHGRHFGDSVNNAQYIGQTLSQALSTAINQWRGWKITRQTSKQTGIPMGLPYLHGFVIQASMEAETC